MSDGSYGCGVNNISMRHSAKALPSVYIDYASSHVPRTFADAIDWSEHVMTLADELGDGMRKKYSYFLTPLQSMNVMEKEVEQADINHEQKMLLMLDQQLDYPGHCLQTGYNVATYGNDFVTMTLAHTRQLICKECGLAVVLKETPQGKALQARFNDDHFTGKCINPKCKAHGKLRRMDHQDTVERKADSIIIKHWPIRELEFDYREARNELQVYWRIPNRIKRLITENDIVTLHDWDVSVLTAACQNKLFMFDDSALFHGKHATLAGLLLQGLGVPSTLLHARPQWLLQLLNKQNQVLAASYINPIPFFSPVGNTSLAGDPIHGIDHNHVGSMVEQMYHRSKQAPGTFHYIPLPVQFQYAAGNADQFVPVQMLQYATDKMTNSLVPMGLLKGDITNQAAPFFLRMFESLNREIPHMYNRFLWWFISRACSLLGMETVGLMHMPSSIADNASIDSMLFQGAQMGKSSDTAWMSRLRMNVGLERSRMLTEQKGAIDLQMEVQNYQDDVGFVAQVAGAAGQGVQGAMQDPAAAGDPAAGGAQLPPGQLLMPSQGYQPPSDPMQMDSDSQQMAQQLGQIDPTQRRRELASLKSISPMMHSLVTKALETMRQQMGMDARKQVAPTL